MFEEKIYKEKMSKTIDVFVNELSSLRTGRANANMLDLIKGLWPKTSHKSISYCNNTRAQSN